jgi:hypothetical protein
MLKYIISLLFIKLSINFINKSIKPLQVSVNSGKLPIRVNSGKLPITDYLVFTDVVACECIYKNYIIETISNYLYNTYSNVELKNYKITIMIFELDNHFPILLSDICNIDYNINNHINSDYLYNKLRLNHYAFNNKDIKNIVVKIVRY